MWDYMDNSYTRRGLLKTGVGATAGAVTAGAAGAASAQEDLYDGYLQDDDSWNGQTADATGNDEIEVRVGAQGNNGPNAFGPSALLVEPGTTVRWVWTGNGNHNVVAEDESFESELVGEEGFEFTQTFDSEGVYKYFCVPHRALGMKGVVVVGEANAQGELADYAELTGSVDFSASPAWGGAAAFGVVSLLGVAAYHELFSEKSPDASATHE
jgi:halocyanin-like protein